jgi:serine/threonine protein kinase
MSMRTIGRYQIKAELGRGGMSTVYHAYDPQFKRDVAIKVLPPELLHNTEFRTRFEREATTIAALEHPAIVPVYDFGEQDGQPYLVMRFMQGKSLKERISQGPIPLAEASRILDRIAPALDYAHQRGIIHRDLKPDNILFDQQNEPYLSDFGIAKLSESGATLTGNTIVGTPAYMSPEQGRGDANLDERSDIYSLGIVLFEMLTGRVPYEANTPMGQVFKHLTEPIPNILDYKEDLPPGCQMVIAQAMAKRSYIRFATTVEMAEALAAAARGEEAPAGRAPKKTLVISPDPTRMAASTAGGTGQTPTAQPAQPYPRKGRPTPIPMEALPGSSKGRRSRAWLFVLVPMLLTIAVGGELLLSGQLPWKIPLVAILPTPTPEVMASPTLEPSPTLSPPTATQLPVEVPTQAPTDTAPPPTLEPSDTPIPTPADPVIGGADKIAFVSSGDIWVANLDGTKFTRLTTTGSKKYDLQWTPDGQAITFIAGKCVQMVDIHTSKLTTITCVNWADYLAGFEISPDGKQVALSLNEGTFVMSYDLQSLSAIRTKEQLESAQACVSIRDFPTKQARWSKDSHSLAVIASVTIQGRRVDLVKVYDVSRCGQPPVRIDEFPGVRFQMDRYNADPIFSDFAWNGEELFALAVNTFNDFGEIYVYNLDKNTAEKIDPTRNRCCYRSFSWSPDGIYFFFAFVDQRFGGRPQLYYIIYGTIGSGQEYQTIPLPDDVLTNPDEDLQPAFRPAP